MARAQADVWKRNRDELAIALEKLAGSLRLLNSHTYRGLDHSQATQVSAYRRWLLQRNILTVAQVVGYAFGQKQFVGSSDKCEFG